jgi:hypothetical protein
MILSPDENEAQIGAGGTQDDIGGIAGATFEIVATEMTLYICPITTSMAERRLSSRLMRPNTPRF